MSYFPKAKLGADCGRRSAGFVGIYVLLGVRRFLVAVASYAECVRREPMSAEFAEFTFATWGNTDQTLAGLVDRHGRQSLDISLSTHLDSGMLTPRLDPDSNRDTSLFLVLSVDEEGKPIQEFLYKIKRSNGGFVGLHLNAMGMPSAIQWSDSSLSKRNKTPLLGGSELNGKVVEADIIDNRAMSMFDWQPAGDQIFAYGALGRAGKLDAYREGFYITQLQTPGNDNVTPMAHMIWDLPGYVHYAFHHDFIAVDGDIVFFIDMNTYPILLYYDTRIDVGRWLKDFPGLDEVIPYLAKVRLPEIYADIEGVTIPIGLCVSGCLLHTVARQSEEDGSTSWTIGNLQPDFDNGVVNPMDQETRLPTNNATRHY